MYLNLSPSQHPFNRLFLTKHCRCFNNHTKGADGAADVLQALSQSTQLEELIFPVCNQIPTGAWQKVRSAKWLKLKKADFSGCLVEKKMCEGFLVFCDVHLSLLEVARVCEVRFVKLELTMGYCIPARVAVPTCFRQMVSDKTLQVLWSSNARSRSCRFASSIESVVPAGSIEFCGLLRDPRSSLATTSGWRMAEAAEGRWHPKGGAPKASTQIWRRQVSDTLDFDAWNCSRWQRGTGGTEASQNCSRSSSLGFWCDGANGTFELFAHWSLGSSLLSWDPGSSVAKTARCQVAQLEEGRFHRVPRREKWLRVFLFYSCAYLSLLEVARV